MSINGAPALADLKGWLGLEPEDTQDDLVLEESLAGALEAQCQVVNYPLNDFNEGCMTADLREAIFIRAQRLAARRNSPEGIVGLSGTGGDLVSARLPSFDSDVWTLEGPHRKIPVS